MSATLESVVTGQVESHLASLPGSSVRLHSEALPAFQRLQKKAFKAGFQLEAVSGFRSFQSQVGIWNRKARGERDLIGADGKKLEYTQLSAREKVFAILTWSALPGASRHHWGTDVDVIDRLSVPPRYEIQLTPQEVNRGGIFCELHDWLDCHMAEEGFFRPYQKDLGGVLPERWHISYAPVSLRLFQAHNVEVLRKTLVNAEMELKDVVLAELPEIFDRYFLRVSDAVGI